MRSIAVIWAFPLLSVAACTTVPPEPEQISACQEMERDMGLGAQHDHAALKGQGRNPMNLTHEHCLRILADQDRSADR